MQCARKEARGSRGRAWRHPGHPATPSERGASGGLGAERWSGGSEKVTCGWVRTDPGKGEGQETGSQAVMVIRKPEKSGF